MSREPTGIPETLYIPEPIRITVSEHTNKLKNEVIRIFNQTERLKLEQKETALKGYLKTFRIKGVEG